MTRKECFVMFKIYFGRNTTNQHEKLETRLRRRDEPKKSRQRKINHLFNLSGDLQREGKRAVPLF